MLLLSQLLLNQLQVNQLQVNQLQVNQLQPLKRMLDQGRKTQNPKYLVS